MHSFIRRENLRRYRGLLVKTTHETVRSQLFKLIAEEERTQILQESNWSLLSTRLTRRAHIAKLTRTTWKGHHLGGHLGD